MWRYTEKIFNKKRVKQTDQMMRSILMHANPEWREQTSMSARVVDPENQDKMKGRRAGAWSGCKRWASSQDWRSFPSIAEELCKIVYKEMRREWRDATAGLMERMNKARKNMRGRRTR